MQWLFLRIATCYLFWVVFMWISPMINMKLCNRRVEFAVYIVMHDKYNWICSCNSKLWQSVNCHSNPISWENEFNFTLFSPNHIVWPHYTWNIWHKSHGIIWYLLFCTLFFQFEVGCCSLPVNGWGHEQDFFKFLLLWSKNDFYIKT